MMRHDRVAALFWCAVCVGVMAGCGGTDKRADNVREDKDFECRDRRVAYIATGSFVGPEVGVVVDCAERGPRIQKWVVLDKDGNKQTGAHSLTPGEFDDLWTKIESTGWRQLSDCDNPAAMEGDPSYKFGIKDQEQSVSLSCEGKELPFPYNRVLNELDLIVAEYSL